MSSTLGRKEVISFSRGGHRLKKKNARGVGLPGPPGSCWCTSSWDGCLRSASVPHHSGFCVGRTNYCSAIASNNSFLASVAGCISSLCVFFLCQTQTLSTDCLRTSKLQITKNLWNDWTAYIILCIILSLSPYLRRNVLFCETGSRQTPNADIYNVWNTAV